MRVIVDPDGTCDMEPVGNVAAIDDRSKKSLKKKEVQKRARNRERAAQRRSMETEGERSQRLEAGRKYSAEKRARESEEKKAERRMMDRKRAAERRARESEWEREHRLSLGRRRAAERRAAENEDEREHRLAQNRERLALKRASKAPILEAAAMVMPDHRPLAPAAAAGPVSWLGVGVVGAGGGDLDGHGIGVDQNLERAGLTTATSVSDPLLPPSVSFSANIRDDEREAVDMMASASNVQPQQEQQQQTAEQVTDPPSTNSGAAGGGGEKSSGELKQEVLEIKEFRAVEPNLERHYNDLLKVISEIGRDVKPAYTNNKVSTDRLRKNIMAARGIVRECVQDVDRLASEAATASQSSSNPPPPPREH